MAMFITAFLLLSLCSTNGFNLWCKRFTVRHRDRLVLGSTFNANGDVAKDAAATSSMPSETAEEIRERLKEELAAVAFRSERGFKATDAERSQARKIIFELAEHNPTSEPASSYYSSENEELHTSLEDQSTDPGLSGKWTLIYTDAPDITGLDQNAFAVLGRIGQECEPPYIRNVIEWLRPSWVDLLPFSGSGKDFIRILQKVVTEAEASPDNPKTVNLKLVGLQVETDGSNDADIDIPQSIEERGILPTLLDRLPINLQGPLKAPFGEFEILYLDEEIRIVRTGQNFLAVNRRITTENEAWF